MSFFFRICCPCLKKERKPKKPKHRTEITETTDNRNLTEIFRIPEEFPTPMACLEAQEVQVDMQQQLGEGSFGKVYRAVDLKRNIKIACKKLKLSGKRDQVLSELKNELVIMRIGKTHENIIQVIKHFIIIDNDKGQEYCYIFMELANGGNFIDKMRDKSSKEYRLKRLTEIQAKHYFRQIANGLAFLHRNGVAHKDLKLSNVLIVIRPDSTELLKISDFGISRIRYSEKRGIVIRDIDCVGTPEHMSPQILKLYIYEQFGKKVATLRHYDPFKADCWALGVCLYIMISAEHPFHSKNPDFESHEEMYQMMIKKTDRYKMSNNTRFIYSAQCQDLIEQLLEPDVIKRITIELVFQHKWLIN